MSEALAILGPFLAGLTFFFWGLDRIKVSLRGIAGPVARRRAAAITRSPIRAVGLGFLLGAITQSIMASSFIVASFVSVGILALRRALLVTAWVNPGTAILPFLAAIDLNLVTLWLIGVAGMLLRNRRLADRSVLVGALFGIGLLLFGIVELKVAGRPIADASWFPAVSSLLAGPLPIAFAVGAALRLVIQSSGGIVVIVIVLAGHGMLDPDHAFMVVAGTGVGTAASVILFGRSLRGEALRVATWQSLLSSSAALVMGSWTVLGATGIVPSPAALLGGTGLELGTQLAVGFLIQMLLCPVIAALLLPWAPAILGRLVSDRAEDQLARTVWIDEMALDTPDVAIELATREQVRVLEASRHLLDPARGDQGGASGLDVASVRAAIELLDREIEGYLAEIVGRAGTSLASDRIVAANVGQQELRAMVGSIDALAREVTTLPDGSSSRALAAMLVEVADLVVSVLADVARHGDPADRAILVALTADRGEQLERIRAQAADGELGAHREQATVLFALSLLERISFLARSYAGRLTTVIDARQG